VVENYVDGLEWEFGVCEVCLIPLLLIIHNFPSFRIFKPLLLYGQQMLVFSLEFVLFALSFFGFEEFVLLGFGGCAASFYFKIIEVPKFLFFIDS